MKQSILFLLLVSLFNCTEQSGGGQQSSTQSQTPVRLAFDEFLLSTSFGVTLPTGTNYSFNTWGVRRPNTVADGTYNYYATDSGTGVVPSECNRTFTKENNILTAFVKCTLPLKGDTKPNSIAWAPALSYEVEIIATLTPLKVTSAKIKFIEYNQTIDITSKVEIYTTNSKGYDQLIVGGGYYQVTTAGNFPLYIKCLFEERL